MSINMSYSEYKQICEVIKDDATFMINLISGLLQIYPIKSVDVE